MPGRSKRQLDHKNPTPRRSNRMIYYDALVNVIAPHRSTASLLRCQTPEHGAWLVRVVFRERSFRYRPNTQSLSSRYPSISSRSPLSLTIFCFLPCLKGKTGTRRKGGRFPSNRAYYAKVFRRNDVTPNECHLRSLSSQSSQFSLLFRVKMILVPSVAS